jgi:hypothetical protein
MATTSLSQLLGSTRVTRVISQLKVPQSRLQAAFGCNPGGPNINPVGGRTTGWDVFNRTRGIAQGRAPGTGPAVVKPQIVGHVTATIYRAHEKIFLDDNRLHLMRRMGQDWGVVDQRGERYVEGQERHLAQRLRNSREFILSRALQGAFSLYQDGDDLIPCDLGTSGAQINLNYQNPYWFDGTYWQGGAAGYTVSSGHIPTLANLKAFTVTLPGNTDTTTPFGGMAGTVAWGTVASNDPITDCLGINAGFEAMHGRQLTNVWCNSTTIAYLFNSTAMKAAAGTANTVWDKYDRTVFVGADGARDTGFEIVFKALPWIKWHVYDAGLDVWDGTYFKFKKFFPDGYAAFVPDVDADWFELQEGSEIVRENVLDPGSIRFGLAAWSEIKTQPSGFELIGLDNCLPVIYVPSCVAFVNVASVSSS